MYGIVRNKEYLERLIAAKGTAEEAQKAQEEYNRRSEQEVETIRGTLWKRRW